MKKVDDISLKFLNFMEEVKLITHVINKIMEITEKSREFIAENAKDALELLTIFRRLTTRIQESRAIVMEEVKDLSEEERTA